MQNLPDHDSRRGEDASQTAILLYESNWEVAGETAFPIQICRPGRQDYPCDCTALFICTQQLHACELYLGQSNHILPSLFDGMGLYSRGISLYFAYISTNLNDTFSMLWKWYDKNSIKNHTLIVQHVLSILN